MWNLCESFFYINTQKNVLHRLKVLCYGNGVKYIKGNNIYMSAYT